MNKKKIFGAPLKKIFFSALGQKWKMNNEKEKKKKIFGRCQKMKKIGRRGRPKAEKWRKWRAAGPPKHKKWRKWRAAGAPRPKNGAPQARENQVIWESYYLLSSQSEKWKMKKKKRKRFLEVKNKKISGNPLKKIFLFAPRQKWKMKNEKEKKNFWKKSFFIFFFFAFSGRFWIIKNRKKDIYQTRCMHIVMFARNWAM